MSDAGTLLRRGARARREGRLADAQRDYAAAVALCRRGGEPKDRVQALKGLGQVERDLGRGDAARGLYEEAVRECRGIDDALLLAHTLRHLGDVHRDARRAELAEPCYREALDLYRGHAHTTPLELANAVRARARLAEEQGRPEEARRLWGEARGLYAAAGVSEGAAEAAARLAGLGG